MDLPPRWRGPRIAPHREGGVWGRLGLDLLIGVGCLAARVPRVRGLRAWEHMFFDDGKGGVWGLSRAVWRAGAGGGRGPTRGAPTGGPQRVEGAARRGLLDGRGPLLPTETSRNRPRASMCRAGRSCLFSPREKIEMRGPLATATGHQKPAAFAVSPSAYFKSSPKCTFNLSPLGETERGHAPQARWRRAGGGQRRAKAHRSPPPSALSRWRPLRNPPAGSSMGGAGRSCLFSPREKIEMRGPLATTTGYRSPPPSRSVTPVTQRPPLGEG